MRKLLTIALAITAIFTVSAQPKVAVNIVIGGMRATDIDRYAVNLSNDGFLRLKYGGTSFTECYTDFIREVCVCKSVYNETGNAWFFRRKILPLCT